MSETYVWTVLYWTTALLYWVVALLVGSVLGASLAVANPTSLVMAFLLVPLAACVFALNQICDEARS